MDIDVDTNKLDVDTNKQKNPKYRQRYILRKIKEARRIKSSQIIEKFKLSREIINRDFNKLEKEDKIIQKGGGNNVWYELKNKILFSQN